MTWPAAFIFAAILAFNTIVLGTTAYAVFWLGHSGWWFLLALMIRGSANTRREDD